MESQLLESPDVLSTLLGRISLRGRVYARPVGCGDWLISPAGHGHASYHLVSKGTCWLHMDSLDEPVQLSAGDVVFFPGDVPHLLSPGPGKPAGGPRLPAGALGDQTQLVCGLYRSQDRELERILRGLPEVVIAHATDNISAMARIIALLLTVA